MTLSLKQATAVIDAAIAEARARKAAPLGIIAVDAGGVPIAYKREDGASLFRFDIARAKAVGALGLGVDTREIARRATSNPSFFLSAAIASGGQLALSAGGVLVRQGEQVIAAVGVSGDAPDIDEACAQAGLRVLGHDGASA